MRHLYFILLLSSLTCLAQDQPELASGSSKFRKINTMPFFYGNLPEPSKGKVETIGETVIYFDKDGNKTSAEKSYFYRKARFNQHQIPVGIVEDYFRADNKPKFTGNYYLYKSEDEKNNVLFQGECVFYGEDNSKSERKYKDGQLLEEKIYRADGKLKSEQIFNPNKTSKYFREVSYGSDDKVSENFVSMYNPILKAEVRRKEFVNKKGQVEKVVEYEGDCPKPNISYFREDGSEYRAVLQEFACPVNTKEWVWTGTQLFAKSFRDIDKKYQIQSNNTGEGFLTIPVNSNLKNGAFEITAEFEKPKKESVKEIGIVWHFQNEQNYSFFLINTEKNTFEVNMKVNGELKKFMLGIKNRITIPDLNDKYILRINSTESTTEYFVNGAVIQGFNKIPLNPGLESKTANAGMFFKSAKPNEYILLTKFECKLL